MLPNGGCIVVTVDCEAVGEEWRCSVTVDSAGSRTTHSVSVTPADLKRWGQGDSLSEVEDLVRRSFEFLLQREAATSILKSFDLSVIRTYFPEYDRLFHRG